VNPLTPHVVALMDKAREIAEAEYPKTPEAARLRNLARVICHKKGLDPDTVAMGGHSFETGDYIVSPRAPKLESRDKEALAFTYPIQPLWMYYLPDAQAMLNTVGMLKEIEDAVEVPQAGASHGDGRA